MAFMMPLVKQNYSLYAGANGNGGGGGGPQGIMTAGNRRRKNSDQTDRRTTAAVAAARHNVILRRNAKSEGTSLSSSPGYPDVHHQHQVVSSPGSSNSSKPMEIRNKNRFSVPTFLSPQSSFRSSGKSKLRHTNSVPVGGNMKSPPPPPVKVTFSPSSRSSISSSSSSESMKAIGKFHSRLIMRLRKTLGLGRKESRPTSA